MGIISGLLFFMFILFAGAMIFGIVMFVKESFLDPQTDIEGENTEIVNPEKSIKDNSGNGLQDDSSNGVKIESDNDIDIKADDVNSLNTPVLQEDIINGNMNILEDIYQSQNKWLNGDKENVDDVASIQKEQENFKNKPYIKKQKRKKSI